MLAEQERSLDSLIYIWRPACRLKTNPIADFAALVLKIVMRGYLI